MPYFKMTCNWLLSYFVSMMVTYKYPVFPHRQRWTERAPTTFDNFFKGTQFICANVIEAAGAPLWIDILVLCYSRCCTRVITYPYELVWLCNSRSNHRSAARCSIYLLIIWDSEGLSWILLKFAYAVGNLGWCEIVVIIWTFSTKFLLTLCQATTRSCVLRSKDKILAFDAGGWIWYFAPNYDFLSRLHRAILLSGAGIVEATIQ